MRESADGSRLEYSHFTVKEFLSKIDHNKNGEFAAYHINSRQIKNELAKVCLTYLNFEDFNQPGNTDEHSLYHRWRNYPFRTYAVEHWESYVTDWNDVEIWSLAEKLFHKSKTNALISWAQDRIFLTLPDPHSVYESINIGIMQASPLHYAAIFGLPEVCKWLIHQGCDIDQWSIFGSSLHCALSLDNIRTESDFPRLEPRLRNYSTQEKVVEVLLEAGADPNLCHRGVLGKMTSLCLATTQSNFRSLAYRLLKVGAIPNDQLILMLLDDISFSAEDTHFILENHDTNYELKADLRDRVLKHSARRKNFDITCLFPRNCIPAPDATAQCSQLNFELRAAAGFGQVQHVKRLLEDQRVDVSAAEEGTHWTALHYAALNDHLEVVQTLITCNADLRSKDRKGRIPFHHCIKNEGCRCLMFFLQRDERSDLSDKDGLTVWHLAIQADNTQALKLLLRHRKAQEIGNSLLLFAAQKGSVAAISLLLDAGLDKSYADEDGRTPLHHTASHGSKRSVQRLLSAGADPNARCIRGKTTVMEAASAGDVSTLKVLLLGGGQPGLTDNAGCLAGHYACIAGHSGIVRALRDVKLDWDQKAKITIGPYQRENVTVLHLAATLEDDVVLHDLLTESLACEINGVTEFGETALFIAAWWGSTKNVALLLSKEADTTVKENGHRGENPLHVATRYGYKEVVSTFVIHGCNAKLQAERGLACETKD